MPPHRGFNRSSPSLAGGNEAPRRPRRRFSSLLPPASLVVLLLLSAPGATFGVARASATDGGGGGGTENSGGASSSSTTVVGPTARLSNGRTDLPLVGIGVGNLPHEMIPDVLGTAVRDMGYALVDTAAASNNERIVAEAVSSSDNNNDVVHVVTKVWYTHLGYERTRLSVLESLSNLGGDESSGGGADIGGRPIIKVHVLLHWPRCYDQIEWMDCEGEEERLPQEVKDAGPPPHLDKENAWRGSWRALEDLYSPLDADRGGTAEGSPASHGAATLESIGISNFEMEDVNTLLSECRVPPHVYQGNAWTLLHDPHLMTLLHERNVHFQAYNVMNGILGGRNRAPNAYALLEKIGRDLYDAAVRGPDGRTHEEYPPFAPSTVILAWLVQSSVSVIPRASSPNHRRINSPASVSSVPVIPHELRIEIERAASALMRGQDLDHHHSPMGADAVSVTFRNALESNTVSVFWIHHETGEEVPQTERPLEPGEEMHLGSHPGHRFAAYAEGGNNGGTRAGAGASGGGGGAGRRRREFVVRADYGDHERFHVDEL